VGGRVAHAFDWHYQNGRVDHPSRVLRRVDPRTSTDTILPPQLGSQLFLFHMGMCCAQRRNRAIIVEAVTVCGEAHPSRSGNSSREREG
jgi:hypothetical protein